MAKRSYEYYKDYYKSKRDEARRKLIEEVKATHKEPDWKPIPGFPDYFISKSGVIINKFGKEMRSSISKQSGYKHVTLTKGKGNANHVYVHLAVWDAFNGTRNKNKQVCHIDSDPLNNNLDNLCEMTPKENLNKESTKNKRIPRGNGPIKLITYKYDKGGNLVKTYDSVKSTAEDGYSVSQVSSCCSGRAKTHKGFIFTHKLLKKDE